MSDETRDPRGGPPKPAQDDDLLAMLGALAREQEADVDWPADEALAPIEGEEAAALFDAVLDRVGLAPPQARPLDAPDEPQEREPAIFDSPAALTAPPGRRLWAFALAATLLLAVVGGAVLLRGSGDPALPAYALTSGAGDQTMRADPAPTAERARYQPGSRVHLIARPAADVGGAVEARLFARQGGRYTPLAAAIQVSATGAVRLDEVAGETLALPEGDGDLVLLVRPVGLDATDEALLAADDPRPAQRLVHPFHFSR